MRTTLIASAFAAATLAPLPALAADAPAAPAGPKITYVDHVLPIFRNACLNCHNPDKKKGNLDLSSYTGVQAGGSEPVIRPGDPDASKLYKVMTWSDEPNMPPKGDKLPEKDLATIRNWIAAGAPETSGSKVVINKPKANLGVVSSSAGKPTGPIAFPKDLPIEPVTLARRPVVASALAASPWAPVIAVGGHKQIVLYNADTLDLLGVLPYPEGVAYSLKFSRNGSLLMAGGGIGAKSGKVVLFDVNTGNRMAEVGDEFDAVLAADVAPDQGHVALGTPLRTVKIYATADGALTATIKKHTDWVQAVAFSPDGKYLATADRAGGLVVWEAANAREVYNLAGHKEGVTDVAFRGDSAVLASASQDGTIKLWSMEDGKPAKTLTGAHAGGVLAVSFTHDGRLVSAGRDGSVKLWGPDGSALKTVDKFNDLAIKATFSHDGQRAIGADYTGQIRVWSLADGKKVGDLTANPPTPAQRLASIDQRIADLTAAVTRADADVVAARKALDQANADLKAATDATAAGNPEKILADARTKRDKLVADVTARLAAAKEQLPKLQATVAQVAEARQKHTQQITVLSQEIQSLRQKVTAKQSAVDAATASLNKHKQALAAKDTPEERAKVEEKTKALAEAAASLAEVRKTLDAKTAEVQTLTPKTPKLAEESKAAQEALAAAKSATRYTAETHPDVIEAKAGLAKAKLAAEVAAKSLPDKQKAAKTAADALAAAQSAAKHAVDALATAKADIPRLKLAAARSALNQAKAALAGKQAELAQLNDQLKSAKPADQAPLRAQADAITKALPGLQQSVTAAQTTYDQTAKDVATTTTPAKEPKGRS